MKALPHAATVDAAYPSSAAVNGAYTGTARSMMTKRMADYAVLEDYLEVRSGSTGKSCPTEPKYRPVALAALGISKMRPSAVEMISILSAQPRQMIRADEGDERRRVRPADRAGSQYGNRRS